MTAPIYINSFINIHIFTPFEICFMHDTHTLLLQKKIVFSHTLYYYARLGQASYIFVRSFLTPNNFDFCVQYAPTVYL